MNQHCVVAIRRGTVADGDRQWTGRLRQHVAERVRVLDREGVVDAPLDGPHSLVGEALQPQDRDSVSRATTRWSN